MGIFNATVELDWRATLMDLGFRGTWNAGSLYKYSSDGKWMTTAAPDSGGIRYSLYRIYANSDSMSVRKCGRVEGFTELLERIKHYIR